MEVSVEPANLLVLPPPAPEKIQRPWDTDGRDQPLISSPGNSIVVLPFMAVRSCTVTLVPRGLIYQPQLTIS